MIYFIYFQTHHMKKHVEEVQHQQHQYWDKNKQNPKQHQDLQISFQNGK